MDATRRCVSARRTRCCHARSSGHGPEVPRHRLVRNAERRQELEVLILHVLPVRVRRDLPVREQPVHVARARAVESELHRRVREARDDARLEVDLQVDHDVEATSRERPVGHRGTRACPSTGRTARCRRRRVSANERRRTGLQHPRDVRRRPVPLERVDHRQHVNRIADRAHHHDADAIERRVRCRSPRCAPRPRRETPRAHRRVIGDRGRSARSFRAERTRRLTFAAPIRAIAARRRTPRDRRRARVRDDGRPPVADDEHVADVQVGMPRAGTLERAQQLRGRAEHRRAHRSSSEPVASTSIEILAANDLARRDVAPAKDRRQPDTSRTRSPPVSARRDPSSRSAVRSS